MGKLSQYVTTRQAAELLGLSKARIDQFCRSGRLRSELVGTVRLIRRADAEAFAKKPRPRGRPKAEK